MKIITPQTIATMRNLRSSGKSLHDIARFVDASLPTIHKYVADIDYQTAKNLLADAMGRRKYYKCKDCGATLDDRAERCRPCYMQSIAKKVKHCCDCGKVLSSVVPVRCRGCNQRVAMAKRALEPRKQNRRLKPKRKCLDCGVLTSSSKSKRCRRCYGISRLGMPDARPVKTMTPSIGCKRCGVLIRGGITGLCKSCCGEKLKEENGTKIKYRPIAKPKRCSCGALILTDKCVACEVRG
jgi:hypothetical protein